MLIDLIELFMSYFVSYLYYFYVFWNWKDLKWKTNKQTLSADKGGGKKALCKKV